MKPNLFLRLVPRPLRLTRLFQRARTPRNPPKLTEIEEPEQAPLRYVPMFPGGHILPYLVDVEKPARKRDPYD